MPRGQGDIMGATAYPRVPSPESRVPCPDPESRVPYPESRASHSPCA